LRVDSRWREPIETETLWNVTPFSVTSGPSRKKSTGIFLNTVPLAKMTPVHVSKAGFRGAGGVVDASRAGAAELFLLLFFYFRTGYNGGRLEFMS
jgi:hypothetical protein